MNHPFRRLLHRRRPLGCGRRRRARTPRLEQLECRQLLAVDLTITELMAANATALYDSDGNTSDWIEIHNASGDPVDLAGWTLTDDPNDLGMWEFPARTLEPGQYLVVFASQKDRRPDAGELHTNFKLAAAGEYLALVSPANVVVSEYGPAGTSYPPQLTDMSYGIPEQGGAPGYLAFPTPGEPNSLIRSAPVVFDHPSGLFRDPFALTLTVDVLGATIHYTVDGTEPTNESPVYTEPIPIASTTYVQAIALTPGFAASTPASAWYLAVEPHLQRVTSDLPIVVLENYGQGRFRGLEPQFNSMAIFEPDEVSGRSSLRDAPTVETRIGLAIRGSSTSSRDKASYSIEMRDEHGDDQALPLLGMASDSDWVLYATYEFDRAMIRNTFIYELSNQVERYATRTRFVELYYNMDGGDVSPVDYRGVYVLMEKITRGPERVDIQQLEPQHDQEPEITGGWMLKIDRNDPGDSGFRAAKQIIHYVDPKENDVTPVQAAWIKNYFDEMYASLTDTNPETGYAQYIDVDSWIDHHILNLLPMNVDAFRLSGYFYLDRGGKIEMGPIWDFDRSMESADGRDDDPFRWDGPPDSSLYFEYDVRHVWWGILFEDPNFMQKWIDRWFELRQDVLSEANITAIIDGMAAEIAEAQVRNYERWPDVLPRGSGASGFNVGALDGTWEGEIAQVKAWLMARLAWIDSQFVAPPVIAPGEDRLPLGEVITLSSTSGTVYYTTDGSDPRLPGGAISPAATLFDQGAPLVFSAAVSITARAVLGDNWSAPVTAPFQVANVPADASHLAVTEINYAPYEPTASERAVHPNFGSGAFEFIELANTGNHTIDLTGVALVDGVEFTFEGGASALLAPGDRVLVVANQDAFEARYAAGLPVAGEFTRGSLSNAGEQIVLVDRFGSVIQDFHYDDADPWPVRADGTGSSLEVMDPAGDYNDAANWRASSEYGGSPGRRGRGPVSGILITEVLSRGGDGEPDLIELHNATTGAVDVSGWYLSDDGSVLRKAMIPHGTTIGAGAYLVLNATDLGLGLSGTDGDDVWLMQSDAYGRLGQFVDHVTFGASDVGVSLGRWPLDDPAERLRPLASPSFGAANSGLRTGDVVIAEVHYHHAPLAPRILAEDFSSGTAADFTPRLGTWAVRDGGYEMTPGAEGDAIATIETGALPTSFAYSATITAQTVAGFSQNAAFIFDYHSPTDFKFVSMHAKPREWRVGYRDASDWHFLAAVEGKFTADTPVAAKLQVCGSAVILWTPSARMIYDFGTPLSDGQVGMGSKAGTARFDQVLLEWLGDPHDLAFLELVGTTGQPVNLEGWRLEDQGAVKLTFPAGTILGAGEALIVVNFDPDDTIRAAFFRETFGIEESVVLAGPYRGRMGLGGDAIRLTKPVALDIPDPGFVLADQIAYDEQAPWPTQANGGGAALSRASVHANGELASSWSALAPTPGVARFAQIGDLNFDGTVGADDVHDFALAIADPAAYQAARGAPATMVADLDGNGRVDFDDIDDFLSLISGRAPTPAVQTAAEPETHRTVSEPAPATPRVRVAAPARVRRRVETQAGPGTPQAAAGAERLRVLRRPATGPAETSRGQWIHATRNQQHGDAGPA